MPRVAYIPMFSSPDNLATCSTFAWANIFFKLLLEHHDDVFVHFGWPTCADITPSWFDHPRVEVVPFEARDSQYTESFNLDPVFAERFGAFKGTTPVDILITDKHACVPGFRVGNEYPTIYNRRLYALRTDPESTTGRFAERFIGRLHALNMQFDFTTELHEVSPLVEAIQSVATTEADLVICRDERVFDQVFATAGRHVSRHRQARLLKTKYIGGYTFDDDLFGKGFDPRLRPTPPPFVVNWGYALTTTNHAQEILTGCQELVHSGHPLRFLLTTPSKSAGNFNELISAREWDSFMFPHFGLPRSKFYSYLNKAHLFVYWPVTPGFCGSPLEQTAFGLLGVYHYVNKPPWIHDDYPFLFGTASDIPHVLKDAMDRYQDPMIRRMVANLQKRVCEEYSGEKDAIKLMNKLFKLSERKKEREQDSRRWLHDLIIDILKDYIPNEISFSDIRGFMASRPDTKKLTVGDASTGFGGFKLGADHLRFAMQDIGWIDDCKRAEPNFVRCPEMAQERFKGAISRK